MPSLIEVEWYELWNGEERGVSWKSLIRQMVKTNYSDSADLFSKRLVVSLCTPFPDLKKMALCCLQGLVTFDLKIRCEVRRLWRLVASCGSGIGRPPIFDVYGCVFLYK